MTNSQFKRKQWTVFILTFVSYASFHACRQSFANAKKSMQESWNYTKHEEGAMDAIFLFSYAFGLYGSGLIGDLFDASTVHSFGLFNTAIILIVFGSLIPYFNIHSLPLFSIIWIFNGLLQSLGYPTAVKLVANWFNTNHDGALFGIWASNQCIGNIIGAGYVGLAHIHNWQIQWMFYLPSFQAVIVSILVYFFVKTHPPNIQNATHSDAIYIDENEDSLELIQQKKQRNVGKKHNNKHYEKIKDDDESLIKHEDDDQHIILPPNKDHIINDDDENNDDHKQRISFIEILKLKNVITYSLCYACLKSVNYTMFFWLPYFESNHFNAADSDYLEMSYNIGQVFGGLTCGYISDRFSKRTPTLIIFLIMATIPIFFLHISTLPLTAVVILTFSAGFLVGGPSNILSTVMAAEIAKDPKLKGNHSILSTVTGIIDGSGSVGAAICQYVVAILSDISLEYVFGLLSLLLIGSATLITPLCIRDICEMRRRHYEFETDVPGGRGRGEKVNNDTNVESSTDVDK